MTTESLLPNSRRHDLLVCRSGRIDISARAARLLNLHPGDVLDLRSDGVEVYLCVRLRANQAVGRHRGRCSATTSGGKGSLRAWSTQISNAIARACNRPGAPQIRLLCGTPVCFDNQTLLPIITRLPICHTN